MRLPRLARHDAIVADGLIGCDIRRARRLDLPSAVLVGRDALAGDDPGSCEDLDAMTDREDPFLLVVERAHDLQDAR
jgi:hypothetical protein